jgi:hypothetical protein
MADRTMIGKYMADSTIAVPERDPHMPGLFLPPIYENFPEDKPENTSSTNFCICDRKISPITIAIATSMATCTNSIPRVSRASAYIAFVNFFLILLTSFLSFNITAYSSLRA